LASSGLIVLDPTRASHTKSLAPSGQRHAQIAPGAFVLLGAAFATGQTHFNPTPQVWASRVFHSLVVSFASFLVWFWLWRHYLASRRARSRS